MKKLSKLIAIGLATGLSATTLLQATIPTVVNASTTTSSVQVTSSTNNSSQGSSDNKWQNITTKSGETMQILPDDPSRMSGKVRYNGEEHSYKITNADGIYTIYLDGDEVCSIDINNSQVPSSQSSSIFSPFINFSYANGKVAFRHAGRKYYYLDTQKYNSESVRKITESGKFILSTLLTLIPGVGPYVKGINFLRELYVINFGKRPKEK